MHQNNTIVQKGQLWKQVGKYPNLPEDHVPLFEVVDIIPYYGETGPLMSFTDDLGPTIYHEYDRVVPYVILKSCPRKSTLYPDRIFTILVAAEDLGKTILSNDYYCDKKDGELKVNVMKFPHWKLHVPNATGFGVVDIKQL